jgi:AcrR family transcriptional regulator
LCYERVKSTYFGKVTHDAHSRTYASDVETSIVEAPVAEPSSPGTAPGAGPSPDRAATAADDAAKGTTTSDPPTDGPAPEVRRKRGRPRDPEADGRILAAASALILMRGFESMTVDEVASNAGVGKATVYRRWSRKEDLAVAAMEQLYRDEMPSPDTGSIRGDLESMFGSVLTFVNSPAGLDYVRTTIKESMRDDRIATLYREASLRAAASATQVFERAIARGEVRADIPVRSAVELLGGLIATRVITGEDMPKLDDLDDLVDLVVHGVGA